jgi:hypothetical protein
MASLANQHFQFRISSYPPPPERGLNFFAMGDKTVLRKDQLEISLHNEQKLIKEGAIIDDNPLDLTEPFRELCEACRKGDLKVCQERITEGVNINARDPYDYTPLILVSDGQACRRSLDE